MQKISGILPSNSRITAVDLKEGPSARPGGPVFGRSMGSSHMSPREILTTTAQLAKEKHDELLDQRAKDFRDTEVVKRLSEGFFLNKLNREESPTHEPLTHESTHQVGIQPEKEMTVFADPVSGEWVEKELIPPGSYVDVRV